jgi:hypothetical protein
MPSEGGGHTFESCRVRQTSPRGAASTPSPHRLREAKSQCIPRHHHNRCDEKGQAEGDDGGP